MVYNKKFSIYLSTINKAWYPVRRDAVAVARGGDAAFPGGDAHADGGASTARQLADQPALPGICTRRTA